MKVRTLRFKLSLTNSLFISVFFVVFGWVSFRIFAYRVEQAFNRGLENQADFFARNVRATADGLEFRPEVASGDVLALDTIRPFFVLTDLSGKVQREEIYGYYVRTLLKENDLDRILRNHSGFSSVDVVDGRSFRFISKILPSSDPNHVYVLHLGRGLDQLTEILDVYTRTYLWSVPFLVVAAAAVGWLLAGFALRPFDEIAKTAELITSEKLNTQIQDTHKEEEVRRLVQSFNSMVSRLCQSFNQMRQFNADVAHELRTPLAILQGESEVALRSDSIPEEVRALLTSNLEELGRLTRIINDLLILSEVEAGAQVLHKKRIELAPLIADLTDQMRLLAAERNVEIEVSKLAEAEVEADDLWLRRAFLNLLDNAIKYSRQGGRIQISITSDAGKARIHFRDAGIGISRQDLPRIFDRLYRADHARNRSSGGTGLGLALVKWVVEAHHGKIHVTSEPDRGADFQVELPLLPPESKGASGRMARTPSSAQALST